MSIEASGSNFKLISRGPPIRYVTITSINTVNSITGAIREVSRVSTWPWILLFLFFSLFLLYCNQLKRMPDEGVKDFRRGRAILLSRREISPHVSSFLRNGCFVNVTRNSRRKIVSCEIKPG